MTRDARQDALAQIVALARAHDLAPREIAAALGGRSATALPKNKAMLFFSALGGIFIFSGIIAFIAMFWGEMNGASRVTITLGSGFALFVMGLMAAQEGKEERYRKACVPLLLMAGWLQPTGLFVLLHEYFHKDSDVRYACLFVFGVMLVQQLATFVAIRRTVLLFFSLAFGSLFFSTMFSLLGVSNDWSSVVVGFSLLNLSYALSNMGYRNLPGAGFLFGGGAFMGGAFSLLQRSPLELFYLALACFVVYVSTVVRSTTLMLVGVVAMLSYIGYFTEEHFVNSIGWPAALIVLGLVFIGIGVGAVKLKKKYI